MSYDSHLMIGLAVLVLLVGTMTYSEAQEDFYVATNGNDAWSGRLPALAYTLAYLGREGP